MIKYIAMQTYTLRGSQFRLHSIAFQIPFIVSWAHHFPTAVAIAPQTALRVILRSTRITHRPRHRYHRYVEQVAYTRSAQMRMRITYHRTITFVVATAPIPFLWDAGGAQLYETKGNVRTYEHMTMSTRSDHRVHIVGISLRNRICSAGQQTYRKQRQKSQFECLHTINKVKLFSMYYKSRNKFPIHQ